MTQSSARRCVVPITKYECWPERDPPAGATIVIVEQDVRAALLLASRAYVLNNRHVVFDGTREALVSDPAITSRYLGLELESGTALGT